jgi:hypothetical protein
MRKNSNHERVLFLFVENKKNTMEKQTGNHFWLKANIDRCCEPDDLQILVFKGCKQVEILKVVAYMFFNIPAHTSNLKQIIIYFQVYSLCINLRFINNKERTKKLIYFVYK